MASYCKLYWCSCSDTVRIARQPISAEYCFDVFQTTPSFKH